MLDYQISLIMLSVRLSVSCLLLSVFVHIQIHAQKPNKSERSDQLFSADEVLNINLKSDFKHFIKNKRKGAYQAATITLHYGEAKEVVLGIKIKPRGKSRNSLCFMPPIKMNFSETEFPDSSVAALRSLKLVTHCKNQTAMEQYILQEYLIYKMYNILTNYSFRVRLVRIRYEDTQGKVKPVTRYGFIIENEKDLAYRVQARLFNRKGIQPDYFDPVSTARMGLFQFMIGNTDWSVYGLHNMKLLMVSREEIKGPLPVPYDFDYSGLINATYAVPDEKAGVETVRERAFRGYCYPDSVYEELAREFIAHEEDILSLYEHAPFLLKNIRSQGINYLEEFFRQIKDERVFHRHVLEYCRPLEKK